VKGLYGGPVPVDSGKRERCKSSRTKPSKGGVPKRGRSPCFEKKNEEGKENLIKIHKSQNKPSNIEAHSLNIYTGAGHVPINRYLYGKKDKESSVEFFTITSAEKLLAEIIRSLMKLSISLSSMSKTLLKRASIVIYEIDI